jgi:hypothetical protein
MKFMKQIILALLIALACAQQACYKDKGNYDYQELAIPQVMNLDTLYTVLVGDTLRINPTITSSNPNARLGFQWSISFPLELRDTTIYSSDMNFVFRFKPDRYNARLTITDSSNGMKYFHKTDIRGITPYSKGIVILSDDGSTSQLTFVRSDGTVEPNVYRTWNGVDLPGKPLQLINLFKQFINPPPALGYWVTFGETNDGGVHIATNSLVKIKSLRGNFFAMPDSAKPGYLETSQDGVLRGVVNGKLMVGSSYTYYGSDIYGMFSLPTAGDYTLYKRAAFNSVMPYFLGYDIVRKQFVGFTNFGSAAYIGTGYQTTTTTPFDPRNAGLDLLHFQQINDNNCYAFGTGADGKLYELKFGVAFMGFVQLQPVYKREFPQPALITPTTKWDALKEEVFFFTSGDKVYRYNPTNQDLQPLVADFGGKAVTMVKRLDDNTLVAGVDGTVYFLDISVGKSGNILKTYTGIPGSPVDVAVKN